MANNQISFKGLKGTFKPIQRNRDSNGIILTYTVKFDGYELECNTLQEAKIMAFEVEQ